MMKLTEMSRSIARRNGNFWKQIFRNRFPRFYSNKSDDYWDYSEQFGPSYWNTKWKAGNRQSPIELLTKEATFDEKLMNLNINTEPLKWSATNTGNNISMKPISTSVHLNGGPLSAVFEFFEMHLHWGEMNVCGCEHVIDGKRRAGELHLVHWNNTKYSSAFDAVSNPEGLAVLGVHVDAQESHACNQSFQAILSMFEKVQYLDSKCVSNDALSPYELLPENKKDYFTYSGSLTTPPLTENVQWTVFLHPIPISMKQWRQLNCTSFEEKGGRETHDRFCRTCLPNRRVISNNFRPVQDLNSRVVRRSFK